MKRLLSLFLVVVALCTMVVCPTASYAASTALVENFDTGLGTAQAYNSAVTLTHITDSGVPYEGAGCVQVATTSQNSIEVPYDFEAGTEYKISFAIKYTAGKTPGSGGIHILGSKGGTGAETTVIDIKPGYYADGTTKVSATTLNTWYLVEETYTATTTTSGYYVLLRLYTSGNKGSGNTALIDNFSITPVVEDEGETGETEDLGYIHETFETGLGSVATYNSTTTVSKTSEASHTGNGSLKVVATKGNSFKIPYNFETGKSYKISFWVNYATEVGKKHSIIDTARGTTEIKKYSFADGTSVDDGALNTWYRVELDYTPTGTPSTTTDGSVTFRLWDHNQQATYSKTAYVDDLYIAPVELEITAASGDEITADYSGLTSCTLIGAAYDGDNRLIGTDIINLTDAVMGTEYFGINLNGQTPATYKVFAWDMSDLTPLCSSAVWPK